MIEQKKEDPDVETLLPWYEKGTLRAKEESQVEDYLKSNPDGAGRFIELIREEVAETIEANEQAGMPSSAALHRLMESIAAEPKTQRMAMRQRAGGFFNRLFGAGAAPWLPAATAAACLVILVQAAALGVLILRPTGSDDPGAGPGLVGGPTERVSDAGRSVLIRFNPDAKAQDIATLLRAMNAQIIEGPKPGGAYRVRISSQPLRSEQIEAILQQMRERSDIIDFIN